MTIGQPPFGDRGKHTARRCPASIHRVHCINSLNIMTSHLLEEALKKVPNQQVLVNVISKRVKQLTSGERPMVEASFRAGFADIALQEVIEGKITLSFPEPPLGVAI